MILATLLPGNSSSARPIHSLQWNRWNATRTTSTTGTILRLSEPLSPKYVSTVDSGNLAGHLLTLRQGLLALPDDKILGPRVFEGLRDTFRILMDASTEARLEKDIIVLLSRLDKELGVCVQSPSDCSRGCAAPT